MKFNNPTLPLLLGLFSCLCILLDSGLVVVARVAYPENRRGLRDNNTTLADNNTTTTNSTTPAPTATNSTSDATEVNCGQLPDRVIPGLEGWQFFATVVGEKDTLHCAATIISSRQVITSRTCGYTISSYTNGTALRVVLGDPLRNNDYFAGQVVWAKNDCSSTDYSIRPTIEGLYQSLNDFLIIPLEEELTIGNTTQPVCTPSPEAAEISPNSTTDMRCLQISHNHYELKLESYEVQYVNCWLEDESQFCFQRTRNRDYFPCHNDSGSPIICKKDGKWHMIGMVTTVYDTCDAGYDKRFSVAAKLSHLQKLDSYKKCTALK